MSWKNLYVYVLSVGPEEHILQSMRGTVGCGDEAEQKEDEIWDTKYMGQLLMDHLFSEWHLLLGVPSKPVPADNILHGNEQKQVEISRAPSYSCSAFMNMTMIF